MSPPARTGPGEKPPWPSPTKIATFPVTESATARSTMPLPKSIVWMATGSESTGQRRADLEIAPALVLKHAKLGGGPVRTGLGKGDVRQTVLVEVSGSDGGHGPAGLSQRAVDGRALESAIAVAHVNSIRGDEINGETGAEEPAGSDRRVNRGSRSGPSETPGPWGSRWR